MSNVGEFWHLLQMLFVAVASMVIFGLTLVSIKAARDEKSTARARQYAPRSKEDADDGAMRDWKDAA